MDSARAAAMSWPDRNYQFRRPWRPPQKRNPVLAGTRNRAEFEISSEADNTEIEHTVQRAIDFALRRAAVIDRTADLLLSVGRVDAAERLSRVAADLRGVAA
jgi:hypothetical protein